MKVKMLIMKEINLEACIKHKVYGCNPSHQNRNIKRLLELNDGDKLVIYVSGLKKIAGIFEVKSKFFESNEPIWKDDIYPYRIKVEPYIFLDKQKWLDIEPFVWGLNYFRNKASYNLHLLQNLLPIDLDDYKYIKSELEKAKSLTEIKQK